jgi:hypothetical protein
MKCAVEGCNSPTQLGTAWQDASMGIAVDATSVYWTTTYPGAVLKCAISGCGGQPTQLASAPSGQGYGGIAVDDTDVYWVTDNSSIDVMGNWVDGPHSIMKCAINGCNTPTELVGGLEPGSLPGRIALDATNVYWTNPGYGVTGTVMTCAKAGCGGMPTTLASEQDAPWDIAVDASNVYWINIGGGDGAVMSCPKGNGGGFFGTPPPTLLTDGILIFTPGGIAADGSNVYFTDQALGTVMKCASGGCGGRPTEIAEGQDGPGGIVVDAHSVYWVNAFGGPSCTDGTVMKLTPK